MKELITHCCSRFDGVYSTVTVTVPVDTDDYMLVDSVLDSSNKFL